MNTNTGHNPMTPEEAATILRNLQSQIKSLLTIVIIMLAAVAYDTDTVYHINQLVHGLIG